MLGAAAADFQDQEAVDEFGLSRLGIPDILCVRGGIRAAQGTLLSTSIKGPYKREGSWSLRRNGSYF